MFRPTLAVVAVALTGLLAACHTGPTDQAADSAPAASTASTAAAGSSATPGGVEQGAFPVTIKDSFGSTTITSEPTRIVALGANDADNLLSLGVVPVGMTKVSWGGNGHGTTDWFDARLKQLGGTQPKLLDDTDSIPMDEIAALSPDLIVATNDGFTKQQYDTLSKIAPVVAYPGAAWVTTWQQTLKMDGEAVGRPQLAAKVAASTEADIAKAAAAHPQIKGKSFVFAALSADDLSSIPFYTPQDQRPRLLTELGMVNAPSVVKLAKAGQFYGTISAERGSSLASDVLITYADHASDAATFEHDPLVGRVPAIKAGHLVTLTNDQVAEADSVPTPLSIPVALKTLVPQVVAALAK
jgi:iron complex transport system substrate-binding protein